MFITASWSYRMCIGIQYDPCMFMMTEPWVMLFPCYDSKVVSVDDVLIVEQCCERLALAPGVNSLFTARRALDRYLLSGSTMERIGHERAINVASLVGNGLMAAGNAYKAIYEEPPQGRQITQRVATVLGCVRPGNVTARYINMVDGIGLYREGDNIFIQRYERINSKSYWEDAFKVCTDQPIADIIDEIVYCWDN